MAQHGSPKPTWTAHTDHGTLSSQDRDDLPDDAYAFPDQRKEPLVDAAHVRTAIARFNQVQDVTDADRDLAWANILAAARHYDVEVEETSWHDLSKGGRA
jgi:hypothetical protein